MRRGPRNIRTAPRSLFNKPTTTASCGGFRTAPKQRPTSSRTTCGRIRAPAVNYAGQTIAVQHSGLQEIYAGRQSAQFFGVSGSDPHHPDVFATSQVGTIFTAGSKIAEHGGDNAGDRDVPLVVYAPGNIQPSQSNSPVETTQIAPTVLKLLGLSRLPAGSSTRGHPSTQGAWTRPGWKRPGWRWPGGNDQGGNGQGGDGRP